MAAVYFGLLFEREPLRELEAAGLCSIDWGEGAGPGAERMPDATIITIILGKRRKGRRR